MEKYVIIVAGGKGLRMGTELPKQFLSLCGLPVLMHTITTFATCSQKISIILVLPQEHQDYWRALCEKYQFTLDHQIVDGGETRFHSVQNGVNVILNISKSEVLVGIHDGVRPLVSHATIARCYDKAEAQGAAFPVIPVIDTLRQKTETGSMLVDRSNYSLVQTPQVFRSTILQEAFQQPYSTTFTDDVSVVEALQKYKIQEVEGEKENLKITTPIDLIIAESIKKIQENS